MKMVETQTILESFGIENKEFIKKLINKEIYDLIKKRSEIENKISLLKKRREDLLKW
jgi:hypothetical protein